MLDWSTSSSFAPSLIIKFCICFTLRTTETSNNEISRSFAHVLQLDWGVKSILQGEGIRKQIVGVTRLLLQANLADQLSLVLLDAPSQKGRFCREFSPVWDKHGLLGCFLLCYSGSRYAQCDLK